MKTYKIFSEKPPNPIKGDVYFDENIKFIKMYDGNNWLVVKGEYSKQILIEYRIKKINKINNIIKNEN